MTWPRQRWQLPSSHWTVTTGAVGSVLAKGLLLGPGPGCSRTAGPLNRCGDILTSGLSVVLTPLFAGLLLRQPPGRWPVLGACLAAVGLGLLSLQRLEVRQGDALVLGCAVAFATHILLLGRYAPRFSTYRLAVVQLATAGLAALAWAGLAGDLVAPASAQVWVALAITSVAASAGAFLVQTRAQREVSPTRTAVILTMEPVFAGLFGFLLAGERLSGRGWLGAGLILAGMLVAELGGRHPAAPGQPRPNGAQP
jgi:drug/metabolite transporter (DMT)-like permease